MDHCADVPRFADLIGRHAELDASAESDIRQRALLSALAADANRRIVYSPHIVVQRLVGYCSPPDAGGAEIHQFLSLFPGTVREDLRYPRFCSLSPGHGYTIALPQERAAQLESVVRVLQQPGDRGPKDATEYPPAKTVVRERIGLVR